MANVAYHVVVPFIRNADGIVVPGKAEEAPNGEAARRRASSVATAASSIGALAFSRTGDPNTGDFSEAVMLATFGEVDFGALAG